MRYLVKINGLYGHAKRSVAADWSGEPIEPLSRARDMGAARAKAVATAARMHFKMYGAPCEIEVWPYKDNGGLARVGYTYLSSGRFHERLKRFAPWR